MSNIRMSSSIPLTFALHISLDDFGYGKSVVLYVLIREYVAR